MAQFAVPGIDYIPSNIASNKYMAENVHDFSRNYTSPIPQFPRSSSAPVTAEVANWPAPGSIAQIKSKELPLKEYAESFPRSSTPPNSAEVKNWPFPQYSQTNVQFGDDDKLDNVSWDPLNKVFGIEETFPRSSAAPTSAEVRNWPFPQFVAKSTKMA